MAQSIQPELDLRTIRAASEYMTVIEIAHALFEVTSQSGKTYTVDLVEPCCECPDFTYHDEVSECKHIRRVRLEVGQVDIDDLQARLESTAEKLETDAEKLAGKAHELETSARDLHRTLDRLEEVTQR